MEIESKLEDLEREKRKKNLVIFNLKESDRQEPAERYLEDESLCRKMFQDELGISNCSMANLIRLGTRRESGNRPLLVKLTGEEVRSEILKLTNRLRNSTRFGNVFINRDMTANEREYDKKLREELKIKSCLLYTSPSPRDKRQSRMPSSA